jgi:hypothetical protein
MTETSHDFIINLLIIGRSEIALDVYLNLIRTNSFFERKSTQTMISIVVCSAKEHRFVKFSQSVADTIGVPFEIIRIDNRGNEYSICGAYNKGKQMCQYDIICFSHEDITFETKNWGRILIDILKDPGIGMVGVFGLCFFSLFPYAWIDFDEAEGQMIVGAIKGDPVVRHQRFPSDSIAEVGGVDGIFMVTRKDVITKFKFADDILKGFHGYDIDINMQIRQHYKIVVTRNIMLYHESGGVFNDSYYESMRMISKRWKKDFPVFFSSY